MKKLLLSVLAAGISLVAFAPRANAGNDDGGDHKKLKVTICHWANGHPHAISPSKSAVKGESTDIGHGFLELDDEGAFVSFTAHDTPGHEQDTFMHFGKEVKPEDDEKCAGENPPGEEEPVLVCLNGFIASVDADTADELGLEVLTDVTQGDTCGEVTTVTTIVEKEVIKEVPVDKIVEKTVEVPGPTMVIERTVTRDAPVAAPAAPVAAPTGELPHTGGETAPLAGLGLGLAAAGALLRRFTK